jgi:hypothetical protein
VPPNYRQGTREESKSVLKTVLIAIDPGASGGIAYATIDVITKEVKRIGLLKMPESSDELYHTLADLRMLMHGSVAYVEEVVRFAGKNISAAHGILYGYNCGLCVGLVTGLGYKLRVVRPQDWQKAINTGTRRGRTRTEWKGSLKDRAQKLFPNLRVTLAVSDALLLLHYAIARETGIAAKQYNV